MSIFDSKGKYVPVCNIVNSFLTIFVDLYQSEINFELSCFFDSGWYAKLGDPINGYSYYYEFDDPIKAVECLVIVACQKYPDSKFAKGWKKYIHKRKESAGE